jgi:hypothetical protein
VATWDPFLPGLAALYGENAASLKPAQTYSGGLALLCFAWTVEHFPSLNLTFVLGSFHSNMHGGSLIRFFPSLNSNSKRKKRCIRLASPRLVWSDLTLEHACACLRSRVSSRFGLCPWTGSLQAWRISYRLSFVSLGLTRIDAQCVAMALPCHVGCCLGTCLRLSILSTSTASPQKDLSLETVLRE